MSLPVGYPVATIDEMIEVVEARMQEYDEIVARLRAEQPRDECAIAKWGHRHDEARWTKATLEDIRGA